MTPEERITALEERIRLMDDGFRNVAQLDPQYVSVIKKIAALIKLTDLSDVNTGATNGQVIKWNSSTNEWDPANDIDT